MYPLPSKLLILVEVRALTPWIISSYCQLPMKSNRLALNTLSAAP